LPVIELNRQESRVENSAQVSVC